MTLGLKSTPHGMKQPETWPRIDRPPRVFDRRKETRYATTETVEVVLLDVAAGPRFPGTVLDVSRSGLRIETAMLISKGMRVEIVLPDRAVIFGEARYCLRSSDLYHIGVAIEVVYYAHPESANHIGDNELNLYIMGNGLTVLEAIH